MSNQNQNDQNETEQTFEGLFEQAEKTETYWIELAKLEFTAHILKLMESRRVSRKELAQKLGVGPGMVTRLLSGNNNFELATMVRLCRAFETRFRPAVEDLQMASCSHFSTFILQGFKQWADVLPQEQQGNNVISVCSAITAKGVQTEGDTTRYTAASCSLKSQDSAVISKRSWRLSETVVNLVDPANVSLAA